MVLATALMATFFFGIEGVGLSDPAKLLGVVYAWGVRNAWRKARPG